MSQKHFKFLNRKIYQRPTAFVFLSRKNFMFFGSYSVCVRVWIVQLVTYLSVTVAVFNCLFLFIASIAERFWPDSAV